MKQAAAHAGNMVTLGEDGVIRHVLSGRQTRKDIIDLRVVTLPLIDQQREAGKPVLLYIDLSQIKQTDSDVRIEARKILEIDYDRLAIIGNAYLQPIITFVMHSSGISEKARYFSKHEEALNWLLHPTSQKANKLRANLGNISKSGWVILLVMVLTLGSAVNSGEVARGRNQDQALTSFNTESDQVLNAMSTRMSAYTDFLVSFRGLYHSSEEVNEKEFQVFFESLNLADKYPGFNAISSVVRVPQAERQQFIQDVQSDTSFRAGGDKTFTISPAGDRQEYFVVTHVGAGQDSGYRGVDLAANDARGTVLRDARDTGEPKATASVNLLDEHGQETDRRGFLLAVPYYKDRVPETTQERQAELEGFITSTFTYKILLSDTLYGRVSSGLHIVVTDTANEVIFESGSPLGDDALSVTRPIVVSGQVWHVKIDALPTFGINRQQQRLPATIYSSGIFISIALGSLFWVQLRSRRRLLNLTSTMTEDLQNERNDAIATHNKDEAILASIGDAVFAIDREDKIILFNGMAEKLSGVRARDALGRVYRDILDFRDKDGNLRDDFIKNAQAGKASEMGRDTTLVRIDGGSLPVADSASPIFDAARGLVGVIVVFRDISSQKMFEEVLQQSNERFSLAAKATSDVVYDLALDGGTLQWNEALCTVYGYKESDRVSTIEWWTAHIHPEDALNVNKAFDQLTNPKIHNWQVDYRFQKADGSYLFVRDRAFVQRDKDGKPTRVIGSMLDVTKQKELDRAKDEFISLVSHQLRTPLTAVRLFVEMLGGGQVGPLAPQQKDYIDKIAVSTKRMIDLVGDILNVSRIEMGRIKIDPVPSDPIAVIKSQLDEIIPLAEKKKVKINFKPQPMPQIPLDPLLFGQIVHNLMTNAIRYTNQGAGEVTISFNKVKDGFELAVSDNGIGIPPEAQSRIFQRFFRADNAVKVEGEGTGLGLYLIKLIVEAAGGSVRFTTAPNKGTTFFVSVPPEGMKSKKGERSLT